MTRIAIMAALALVPCLSACGDNLGEYKLEDVVVTKDAPAVDGQPLRSGVEYFRVALSSAFSLYAAETGPGLYTDGDFCPIRDPDRIIAFGPVASDGKPVEKWKRDKALERGSDGRFHYHVYVTARSPARKLFTNSKDIIPAYDLRDGNSDLCLRFHVNGYNIIPSRSGEVKIPASMLVTASQS